MTREEIKKAIKVNLPIGYISKLSKKLKGKYSESYIGQVCDPNNSRWNQSIIDSASKLALANKRKLEKVGENISELL